MRRSKFGPRLCQREIRDIGRACKRLAALNAMLQTTSVQWAPAALLEIQETYELLAPIYNRGEPLLPEFRNAQPPESPQEAPQEQPRDGSTSPYGKAAQGNGEA
jgi:hypothetical protein